MFNPKVVAFQQRYFSYTSRYEQLKHNICSAKAKGLNTQRDKREKHNGE